MKSNIKKVSGETCYICSRKHKIFAWFVLFGIFLCGMLTGVSLWGYKHAHTADYGVESANLLPCQMRENALMAQLNQNIDDGWVDTAANAHKQNADVYDNLMRWGCTENQKKYEELRDAEFSVFDVLKRANGSRTEEQDKPCQVIERTLIETIHTCPDSQCHLYNAEVYSKIAEDGCPENSEKYKQMALDELQISEGVRVNDGELSERDVRTTVNTYKKLQMQNEARRYIKKAEKLINPGVDFIMELQRVIEE